MAVVLAGATHLEGPIGDLPTSAPLTLACWVRPTVVANESLVVLIDSALNDRYLQLGLRATGGVAAVARVGALQKAETTTPYALGEWQHVAAVFSSDTERVAALDGELGPGDSSSATAPSGLNTIGIGALVRPFVASHLNGDVADVAVWSAALDAEELAALAAGVRPPLLRGRLGDLRFYRALWAGIDEAGVGSALSVTGPLAEARHPPLFGGGPMSVGRSGRLPFRFARGRVGQATVAGAEAGRIALAGAAAGGSAAVGEVW